MLRRIFIHRVSTDFVFPDAEYALRQIFRRCLECAPEQTLCPPCTESQTCVQKPGDGCTTCTQAVCVSKSEAGVPQTTPQSSGGGPNVGAIAGGVVGGVAFIAILTFVIWRFCIRPRYNYPEEEYSDEYNNELSEKSPGDYAPTEQARNSTHSVRSVASTVMTRASNVIQIAFIPGITDRQGHDDGSIPPVPAIPGHQRSQTGSTNSPANRHPGTPDHFFTPADLGGDSRWSQFSNSTTDSEDIRSIRPHSLASSLARESVASTIFQGHQATPMSAAQGVRGKANVVSVKPSTGNTPSATGHVPEVPVVDYFKYGDQKKKEQETPKDTTELHSEDSPAHTGSGETSVPDVSVTGSEATTGKDSNDKKPSSKMLAAAIEEATRRASKQPTHGGLGSLGPKASGQSSQLAHPQASQLRERDPSPFADSNAVHTP